MTLGTAVTIAMAAGLVTACHSGKVAMIGGTKAAPEAASAAMSQCGPLRIWVLPDRQDQEVIGADSGRNQVELTKGRISLVALAAGRYCVEHGGRFPKTTDELVVTSRRAASNKNCRLAAAYLRDAWGNPLLIHWGGGAPTISSPGPDGQPGTADDIALPGSEDHEAQQVNPAQLCRGGG